MWIGSDQIKIKIWGKLNLCYYTTKINDKMHVKLILNTILYQIKVLRTYSDESYTSIVVFH